MRSLNSAQFFHLFQALAYASNADPQRDRWTVAGVDWGRERRVFWGVHFSFQLETHVLESPHRDGVAWALLVVTERWWGPDRSRTIHEARWARMLKGPASLALAWLKRHAPEQ